MRGDLVEMLMYECKVKPAVAALVNQIDSMSHTDIENAVVPLPWYRTALLRLKDQNQSRAQEDRILANILYGVVPDPLGWMAEYTGDRSYFTITENSAIEVNTGTLVWFPMDGGVWIETTFCRNIDVRMFELPPIKQVTKTEYTGIYRAKINGTMASIATISGDKPLYTITRN